MDGNEGAAAEETARWAERPILFLYAGETPLCTGASGELASFRTEAVVKCELGCNLQAGLAHWCPMWLL